MKKNKKIFNLVLGSSIALITAPMIALSCNRKGKEKQKDEEQKKEAQQYIDDLKAQTTKVNEVKAKIDDTNKEIKKLEGKTDEASVNKTKELKSQLKVNEEELATAEKKIERIKQELSKEQYQNGIADYILSVRDGIDGKVKAAKLTDLGYPSKETAEKYANILQETIKELTILEGVKLQSDLLAWYKGLTYNWEIEAGNYTSGLRYLFASFDWGTATTYAANSFYESILLDAQNDLEKAKAWTKTLGEAVELDLVISKIQIKNNLNDVVQNVYKDKLLAFAKDNNKHEITVKDLIGLDTNKKEDDYTAQDWIDKFYTEYATTYYNASKFGFGENVSELKLTKTNDNNTEKENTIELVDGDKKYKIYGLGLTEKDLNQEKIGLVNIPGKQEEGSINGKTLYNQLLKMATTSSYTPKQVFDKGIASTLAAKDNMLLVAKEAANLIVGKTGKWEAKFKYDDDGLGPNKANEVTLVIRDESGNINFENFLKWLNAEDFFFGREDKSYYTDDLKAKLKSDEFKWAREELTKYGYDVLIAKDNKDKEYGSITNEQFYYGALEGFRWYKQFKDTTQEYGRTFFGKEVPDYNIDTYKYEGRDQQGVGAYNSNSLKFQFNVDPYYGLPKWSVTSFANHESMMGHHNQLAYAKHHLAKVNGKSLGASQFDYTSYVEGWALFMEWFGIENGFYGTRDLSTDDANSALKDFSLAKGITSFFTAKEDKDITEDMINQIKTLHGGVYWTKVNENSIYNNDKDHAKAAVKLTNLLQYFGALNEAQLRNMRLAVDTNYHGEGTGDTNLKAGASIKQVRDFMKKNSALGIGDITSESKRYFNLAGQATAYNSGKEVMVDLYKQVYKKLGLSREEFLNKEVDGVKHAEIKKFFDYLLRNSALPLDALSAVIKSAYNI